MGNCFSGLSFVPQSTRACMSDEFAGMLELMDVENKTNARPNISFEAATVDDWWVCRATGTGSFKLGGFKQGHQFGNRVLLTLMMFGRCQSMGDFNFLQPPGYISLCHSNPLNPILTSGSFAFLAASIPRKYFEEAGASNGLCDRSVNALSGSGFVVAAAYRAFVEEALRSHGSSQIAALAPDFTRLALGCLTRDAEDFPMLGKPQQEIRHEKILTFMKLRYGARPKLTPGVVAAECGVSVRQLHRDFAARGKSFVSELMNLRLNAAAGLLAGRRSESIGDIAYGCGFESPTHFGKVFKDYFGCTPSEFRKNPVLEGQADFR